MTVKDVSGFVLHTYAVKSDGYGKVKVEGIVNDFPADKVQFTSATAGPELTAIAAAAVEKAFTRDTALSCAGVSAGPCAIGAILTVTVDDDPRGDCP